MNGNGKAAEWPKIQGNYKGGFQYGYQFPEGSHASVPAAGVSVSPGSFYLCVNRCRYNVYNLAEDIALLHSVDLS